MPVARYCRYEDGQGILRLGEVRGVDSLGVATQDTVVVPIFGSLFGEHEVDGPPLPLASVTLRAPVSPSKVVGIGSNYAAHIAEMGRATPTVPKVFVKPSTSVVGPGAPIVRPVESRRVDHEAELALVIGRHTSRVSVATAMDHVLGITACNDVTARDWQKTDGTFARGKGADSFCPLGPWITTGLSPHDLRVRAWVDGELRQDGRTSDLVFGLAHIVAFVSHVMTLLPGDVIATGTPAGVGPLLPGQTVRVAVDGVGVLENPVVAGEPARL